MLPALEEAARAARAIAVAAAASGAVQAWQPVGGHQLYLPVRSAA